MASRAMKNEEVREFARRFVRVLNVNDGDVILLKTDNLAENIDMFNGLRHALGATDRKKCLIVAVKELDDVEALSPESMAEYGWYKKDDEDENPVDTTTE